MGPTLELYREEPTRRRECLYYLALGYYKMGNFDDARKFNSMNILTFLGVIIEHLCCQAFFWRRSQVIFKLKAWEH